MIKPISKEGKKREEKGEEKASLLCTWAIRFGGTRFCFSGPIKMFETKKHILCLLAPNAKRKP